MEDPPIPLPPPQNSKKRMFNGTSGGGSGSSSSFIEPDLMEIPPPAIWKSNSLKKKSIVNCEVINLDGEDPDDVVVVVDEKVAPNAKGKKPMLHFLAGDEVMANDGAPFLFEKDFVEGGSSSHVSFIDDDFEFGGMDVAETFYDKECAMLQAHFDYMDIPSGVEAAVPWWPSGVGSEKQSVTSNNSSVFGMQSNSTVGVSDVDQSQSWSSHKPLPFKKSVAATGSSAFGKQSSSTVGASGVDQFQSWHSHKPLPSKKSVSVDESSVFGTQSNSTVGTSDVDQFQSWHSHKHLALKKSVYENAIYGSKPPYSGFPPTSSYSAQNSGMIPPEFGWPMPPDYGPNKQASFTHGYYPFVSQGFANPFLYQGFANPFVSHTTSNTSYVSGGNVRSYMDASVRLDDGISAQISPPCSNGQGDDSENSLVKKLELFKIFDTLEDHTGHLYLNERESCSQSKTWVNKIAAEWRMLERDLPGTIFVRVYEARMDLLRAVIIGADGTPYHDGLFFFDVNFPVTYPNVPPFVKYHAHGLRINPNLYNSGKVCLSLLGTWSGSKVENWRPGKSNMLQVLLSIQGLILNAEPYFNEPGFEHSKYSEHGRQRSKNYSENAFLLSLKSMLYTMRNPPKFFENLVFGHFYMRAHDILAACKAYLDGVEVGSFDKSKSPSSQVNGSNCSELLKMNLPTYIKSLVEAFTKIGVKDCEKYLVPIDKVVHQSTRVDSSSHRKIKLPPFIKEMQHLATLRKVVKE